MFDRVYFVKDAKLRLIFDEGSSTFNFAKRRVSDIKGNSRVIFPRKVKNFDIEAKLKCLG